MKKELGFYAISMALFYIAIGILMLVNPKFVCDAVNYVIGSIIMILGIFYLFKLLQNKQLREFSKLELLIGFFAVGFGLFLLLNKTLLVSILPLAAGIILLLDAISQISNSFRLKKYNSRFWYVNLTVGILFLSFAVFLILNAQETTYLIVRLIGSVLIVDGVFEMYTYFKMNEYNGSVKVIEATIESKEE